MVTKTSNFDPIIFLEVAQEKLTKEEVIKLRQSLVKSIAEYLSIKLFKYVPSEKMTQLEGLNDSSLALAQLNNLITDFEGKVIQELENFKKDFKES